ncbi:MAG: ComF family protein [Pseudomonadota bacterium]
MARVDRALRSAIQTGLEIIYPARCLGCGTVVDGTLGLCGACWRQTPFIGGTVCDSCGVPVPGDSPHDVVTCDSCLRTPPPWDRGRAALLYRDLARKLVLGFKHGDRTEVAQPAGRWLARAAAPLLTPDTLIAPIPLHWRRMFKRRYNQSALLAQALAQHTGHDVCLDLLTRTAFTPVLDGKSRDERAQTLDGALRLNPRRARRVAGRPVLLVDDVMTSGATLSEATRVCQAARAGPVCVVALARVAQDT